MTLTLAAITFTWPFMLWGMAMVALPLLAHLMHKRTRRRIIFPAIQLLHQAAASQSKLFRLRRWILLALRSLAVILLAWAFARPQWAASSTSADGTGDSAVVFILDVSASTAQRPEGLSVSQRMAGIAERLIGELTPGVDKTNIVYAGIKPVAAYPKPIVNLAALRQEAQRLQATQEWADLPGAVAMAHAMLAEQKGSRQVVVLSDMQQTNWGEDLRSALGTDSKTDLRVVPVGSQQAANTGILKPTIYPPLPLVGHPCRIAATLANYADHSRTIQLTAQLDGKVLDKKSVSLSGGEQSDVVFDVVLEQHGPHRVVLSVSDDDLPLDDNRYLVIHTAGRANLLIVSDAPANDPSGDCYYLQRALAPHGDDRDTIKVSHVTSVELNRPAMRDAHVVVLGHIGSLGSDALQGLVEHVRGGGGVLFMLGHVTAATNAAMLQQLAGDEPLLPFQPLGVKDAGMAAPAWSIVEGAWSHPALRSFDESSQLALEQILFTRIQGASEVHAHASVLLRYNDSTPVLATIPYQNGKLAMANFSASPADGNLPKHGAFVALLHGMMDELRPQTAPSRQLLVGQSLPITGDAEQRPTLLAPSGQAQPLNEPLLKAGFYRLQYPDGSTLDYAANIDERESDLRRIKPVKTDDPTGSDGSAAGTDTEMTIRQQEHPLWWWFVLGAAAAIGLELLLLSMWRK